MSCPPDQIADASLKWVDAGPAQFDRISIVGHELRNLLATVVGFSELLLSNEVPEAERRDTLELMRNEALRGSSFLQQLLDLQRMESGAVAVTYRPTDLRALLFYAAAVASNDAAHPIVLECPSDLPLVQAEPDRIQQVMANLLSNARKYSPAGGEILISAYHRGETVEVSVSDHGVGIPQEALPRVFETFYRVESLSHRGIKGTGLGLAICRTIVTTHGGEIWAESAGPGLGTCLSFTLPVANWSDAEKGRRAISGTPPGLPLDVNQKLPSNVHHAKGTAGRESGSMRG